MSIDDILLRGRAVFLLKRDPGGDPYDRYIATVPEISVQTLADLRASGQEELARMIDGFAGANATNLRTLHPDALRAAGGYAFSDQACRGPLVEDLDTSHGPPVPPPATLDQLDLSAEELAFHDAWSEWLQGFGIASFGDIEAALEEPDASEKARALADMWTLFLEGVDVETALEQLGLSS